MKKMFYLLFLITIPLYFFWLQNFWVMSTHLNYFSGFKEIQDLDGFSFSLDNSSVTFLLMVVVVTSLVCLFSESYMEHYSNKKFFFLMLIFFLSMLLLIHSSNFLTFFVGWDLLGISSFCLIMFYPNKMTLFNSFLTMMYNRLGDVLFLFLMCYMLLHYQNFLYLLEVEIFPPFFFFLLVMCSFTKSAQFPLSSWLPAAMSAPTPISAMVHSSTLVTAGVYLIHKLTFYFLFNQLILFLLFFSLLTFMLGGLMANVELDYKKMIAFSTMSQISMIIVFCSLGFMSVALSHTLFHALFKTMLFSVSGLYFTFFFSGQLKNHLHSSLGMNFTRFLVFLSLFSMSGLIFSSSFFTKDLIMEMCCFSGSFFLFFFILMGSFLTIQYTCKLATILTCSQSYFNIFNNKFFFSPFWLMFSLLMCYSGPTLFCSQTTLFYPIVSNFDLTMVMFFILSPLLFSFLMNFKLSFLFSIDTAFMKTVTYSAMGSLMDFNNFSNMFFSEIIFLKKYYFWAVSSQLTFYKLNLYVLYLVFASWFFFF